MRALALAAMSLCLAATPAAADSSTVVGSVDKPAPDTYEPIVEVGLDGDGGGISPGTDPLSNCTFAWSITGLEVANSAERAGQINGVTNGNIADSTELFNYASCPAPGAYFLVWVAGDPVPRTIANDLAARARSRVQIPLAAPLSSPDGTAEFAYVTQMPVWFWVDEAVWAPQTRRASLAEVGGPGNVWVQVTADPTGTSWDPGDGSPVVTCGAGLRWEPGLDDDQSPCSHTYTQRPEDTFALSLETRWDMTVACSSSALCDRISPLGDHIVTTTRDVSVISIVPVLTG